MEKQLLRTIEIVDYPREAILSKSIRPKYIKPTEKLLKRYLSTMYTNTSNTHIIKNDTTEKEYHIGKDKDNKHFILNPEYIWKKKGTSYRLYHTVTQDFVAKNANQVGTERKIIIKGQDITAFSINEFTKDKIFKFLKEFWKLELLKCIDPILFSLEARNYPVAIHIEYNAKIEANNDLDNYSLPYHKTLLDSMVTVGILRGDTIRDIDDIRITHKPIEESDMGNLTQTWGTLAQDKIIIKIYGQKATD